MQWFYLDANQQQVPADESELSGLVQNGTITREVLLWNETLSDWQSAAALFPSWFPESAPAANPAPAASAAAPVMRRAGPKLAGVQPKHTLGMVKRTIHTAHEQVEEGNYASQDNRELIKDFASFIGVNVGWMKFLGVMHIIFGVFTCISVVGALWGWLPIWLGVIMFKAANAAFSAQLSGSQEDLEEALDRVSFFFKLQGILMLVWLILTVLSIVSYFIFGAMIMMAIMEGMQGQGGLPME